MSKLLRGRFSPTLLVLGLTSVVAVIAVGEARTAELRRQLDQSNSLGKELDDEQQAVAARRAEKRAVARELAAGRVSLAFAADRFLTLDGGPGTDATHLVRAWLPAPTAWESEARSAALIATEVVPDPAERERVKARLRAELERFGL